MRDQRRKSIKVLRFNGAQMVETGEKCEGRNPAKRSSKSEVCKSRSGDKKDRRHRIIPRRRSLGQAVRGSGARLHLPHALSCPLPVFAALRPVHPCRLSAFSAGRVALCFVRRRGLGAERTSAGLISIIGDRIGLLESLMGWSGWEKTDMVVRIEQIISRSSQNCECVGTEGSCQTYGGHPWTSCF